ncbi:hypothetical protein [Kitasatospora sp. NPDC056531]|uniref:hypothetical protein n=1 Tax=Kitasatospora sp. NPDC056531 TaxID=3345856 RepID=UPI00367DD814
MRIVSDTAPLRTQPIMINFCASSCTDGPQSTDGKNTGKRLSAASSASVRGALAEVEEALRRTRPTTLRLPRGHPPFSGRMLVFVEEAAESVGPAYVVDSGDLLRGVDRLGKSAEGRAFAMA